MSVRACSRCAHRSVGLRGGVVLFWSCRRGLGSASYGPEKQRIRRGKRVLKSNCCMYLTALTAFPGSEPTQQ